MKNFGLQRKTIMQNLRNTCNKTMKNLVKSGNTLIEMSTINI